MNDIMHHHNSGCSNCGRKSCGCNKNKCATGATGGTGGTGSTGSTGATGTGGGPSGLLKFSGVVDANAELTTLNYLPDSGFASGQPEAVAIAYPAAISRTLQNLSINVVQALVAGSVTVQLLRNGAPVLGFSAVYTSADPAGVPITTLTAPEPFNPGDTFDLLVTTTPGTGVQGGIRISASVGVGP